MHRSLIRIKVKGRNSEVAEFRPQFKGCRSRLHQVWSDINQRALRGRRCNSVGAFNANKKLIYLPVSSKDKSSKIFTGVDFQQHHLMKRSRHHVYHKVVCFFFFYVATDEAHYPQTLESQIKWSPSLWRRCIK